MLWDLGQHLEASRMMRDVVEISKRVFDKDHPQRKNSEGWLDSFEKKMPQLRLIDSQKQANQLRKE
ncbi:hypothetical protein A1O3_01444 [Capronia epimyces CBS 606.96]|uniref:Uncharacterized protein n=1 Tax=Capronia epimyces CBS 606.96 TaxID=1182542 RepID=W9YTB2_9EURO|nr:uncharacterized protein A1O3_01444 [Capronia epimyces CBS 606.96]EXJ92890.1 hypothetical protein A1O3_01444 [Capronia epimyces CBS 606.96]